MNYNIGIARHGSRPVRMNEFEMAQWRAAQAAKVRDWTAADIPPLTGAANEVVRLFASVEIAPELRAALDALREKLLPFANG